ncbi:DNRLRE domain-containing protein, partial [Candidatus Parcubacteria bacterium]|nr:DNRLRE domain-containing protein [Candidatus Parcubacteria bacterium]
MALYQPSVHGRNFLKKGAALLLLFSFVSSLISPGVVYAQENIPDQVISAPIEETPAPVPPPNPEPIAETNTGNVQTPTPTEDTPTPTDPQASEPATPEEAQKPESEQGVVPEEPEEPEMAMSSGGSMTEAGLAFINNQSTKSSSPEIDAQTGALTHSLPLSLPPGRNGMTPDVNLHYSSNSTDDTGIFGYGWSVSIPYIERVNRFGVQSLYASSTPFYSSLDGELVQIDTTTYQPRVEDGSFRRYTLQNNMWTVLEKDGTKHLFGSSTTARRDDPNNSSRIFGWYLEESRDSHSNYIEYSYYKDTGQIYPDVVSYTGNGTTDGIFTITFSREARNDNLVSYKAGFAATTTFRISRIETSISGSWIGRYDLGYSAGHNGNRSLLTSITQFGRDEAGSVISLPSLNFGYETYGSSEKEWAEDENWYIPVNIIREEIGYDDGARFVDINSDALPDIIRSWDTNLFTLTYGSSTDADQEVFLNTGSGWATSSAWALSLPYGNDFGFVGYDPVSGILQSDLGARFVDINKDGFTDILWGYYGYFASIYGFYSYSVQDVYINNRVNGWATSSAWTIPSDFQFVRNNKDGGGRIADVNGDTLPDLLIANEGCHPSSCLNMNKVYLNTGNGWQEAASSTWSIPEMFLSNSIDAGTDVADINGDGLADIVHSVKNDWNETEEHRVYLNTGAGWQHAPSWNVPHSFLYIEGVDGAHYHTSSRLADVNGDNLPDLVSSAANAGLLPETNTVYINSGEGWVLDSSWTVPPYFKFGYSNDGFWYTESGVAGMDFDGDNMPDFVKSGPQSSSPTYPQEKIAALHDGKVPDLLSSIEYPEGGETLATYKQSAQYTDAGGRTNTNLPSNLNTTQVLSYDDGETASFAHTYTYGGGLLYFASSTDNQFAGFATTTKTDARGNVTKTHIHQGNGSQESLGEYNDTFAKIGKPFLKEVYDDDSNLYVRSISRWDMASTSTTTAFVFKAQDIGQHYDGDADHKDTATEYSYSTVTGNLSTTTEWGEVSATSTTGFFADTGFDKRTTVYSYANATSTYVISLPSSVVLTDQSSVKKRELKFYYDNLAFGFVGAGNRTKTEDWIESSTYAVTTDTFNAFGLPTQTVDPRYATTTYTYDTHTLYPKLTTNALGHTASSSYDYSVGKPKATTDANGHLSQIVFDGLDRVLMEKGPDPETGASVTLRTNTYTDSRGNVSTQTDTHLTASSSVSSYSYFDGFGRKIQTRTEAEEPDEFVVHDVVYGEDGLVAQESLPYFDEGENDTNPTNEDELLVAYQYDPLGRVVSVENAAGETTTAYDQWQEMITDPLSHLKTFTSDAFGRLTSVLEHNASSTHTTSYEWNQNDKLTKITDALGNVRNFTYDGLGRRLTAEDLHDVGDGTFGTWSFTYDASGNLTESTDPKGQLVQSTYDLLNRPQTSNFTGTAGTEETYAYDNCANGIGRLCSAVFSGATTTYAYKPNGLPSTETRIIGGASYTTQYAYDRAGNPLEITYPDNSTVRYSYNASGNVETLEQKESGGTYESVVADLDYGPHALLTYQENANCTFLKNVYDPLKLYRLQRKTVDRLECGESMMSGGGEFGGEGFSQMTAGEEIVLAETPYDFTSFFNEEDGLITGTSSAESLALLQDTASQSSVGTTTDARAPTAPEFSEIQASSATSSPDSDYLKSLPANAPELTLESPPERHLGTLEKDGMVKYAYRTDITVDSLPIDKHTLHEAEEAGVLIGFEVVSERTSHARTFSTDKPHMFVAEIISGDPQYYEDENGTWWLADYGVTTKEAYDRQINEVHKKDAKKEGIVSKVFQAIVSLFVPQKTYAASQTFYPGATSVDGEMYKDNANSWSVVRDASASNWGGYTGNGNNIRDQYGNGNGDDYYGIRRAFLLFDTSALPDSASITSANLNIYITGFLAAGSEKRYYIVASTPASNTSLTHDDYDQVGSVSFGESDGTYTAHTYESTALNSSGLTAISKTGVSKFAIRTYNDFTNTTPTNSNEFDMDFTSAEESGTGADPKLVVVYTSAPSIPIAPLTEGAVNPSGISDQTPDFSAVFIDPDEGDEAISYRLQVGTSASDWTSPVWDSNKQALQNTVGNGYRSSNLVYEGTTLTPDITYYWRIKFWDFLDNEGLWSTTTASFSLAPPLFPLFDSLYLYDAVGNITSVTDIQDVDKPLTEVYGYDDLYRLVSVGTTTAKLKNVGGLITIQPDSTNGKDTNYGTTYHLSGNPDGETIWIGGWGESDEYFTFIQFHIGAAPDASDIEYAKLYLYNTSATNSNEAKLFRITQSWNEAGVSNGNYPASTDMGMAWQAVPDNNWWVVDVTQLVKDWKSGTHTNYGVMVDARYNNPYNYVKYFASSEYATSTYRPKLEIKAIGQETDPPKITLGTTTPIATYTYDALGNIASTSGLGVYAYAETGYANPHAATSIGGTGLLYDNNGNLTSYGTKGFGWDYKNQMV